MKIFTLTRFRQVNFVKAVFNELRADELQINVQAAVITDK